MNSRLEFVNKHFCIWISPKSKIKKKRQKLNEMRLTFVYVLFCFVHSKLQIFSYHIWNWRSNIYLNKKLSKKEIFKNHLNCFLVRLNISYRCNFFLILCFQENLVLQLTWFDSILILKLCNIPKFLQFRQLFFPTISSELTSLSNIKLTTHRPLTSSCLPGSSTCHGPTLLRLSLPAPHLEDSNETDWIRVDVIIEARPPGQVQDRLIPHLRLSTPAVPFANTSWTWHGILNIWKLVKSLWSISPFSIPLLYPTIRIVEWSCGHKLL